MKYCQYYWLFERIEWEYRDSPSRQPAVTIQIIYFGDPYELGIFCDKDNVPEFARITIRGLQSETLPEELLPFLGGLGDHLLSVLRLAYWYDIRLLRETAYAFFDDGKPYDFRLRVAVKDNYTFDPDKVGAFLMHSLGMREDVHLLIDGMDERIPIQYRFLSLYKLLEKRFKKAQVWDSRTLKGLLDRYHDRFVAAEVKGTPASELHAVRDMCAHIRTGRRKLVFGVTHLNQKEALRTRRVFPILQDICVDLINAAASGKFIVAPPKQHGEQH